MAHTYAIGDIHGCIDPLNHLIDAIERERTGGTVVFLGDYIDRGPDSRGVVARIMAGPTKPGWRWIALKGNHEEMMVSAGRGLRSPSAWLINGGSQTLTSYDGRIPNEVLDWAAELPMLHGDRHRLYVHAGVDESLPLAGQTAETLLWSRPRPGESGRYWGKHLVHGHTPGDENPLTTGNRTNIDSGCVYGGALTAAEFDDDVAGPPLRFFSIPNRQVL